MKFFRFVITWRWIYFILLIPVFLFFYKIYIGYINAFGCFDECMNIGAAYFLNHGKILYSQILFNHQPIMAYVSLGIQNIFHPAHIYELLLRHMQFGVFFSFIFSILLIFRFGRVSLGFIIFYELSKFYIFGNRFLAESYIVYLLAYISGLIWNKYSQQTIHRYDYFLLSIFSWIIIFSREPFTLTVMFAYFLVLGIPRTREKKIAVLILILLSLTTLSFLPVRDYFYSVFIYNTDGALTSEFQSTQILGSGLMKIFLYPFYTLFNHNWNEFWVLLVSVCYTFIILTLYHLIIRKKYVAMINIYLLLGLTNIRYLNLGDIYYGAFHIIPWWGMILMFTFLMIRDSLLQSKKRNFIGLFVSIYLGVCFLYYLSQPLLFFKSDTDLHRDLITHYGKTIQIGETVRLLSTPEQTFYVDNTDWNLNLVYWQSQRRSSYLYSWFTYIAPDYHVYQEARKVMLENNPPDFFFAPLDDAHTLRVIQDNYTRLLNDGVPSDLYLKTSLLKTINSTQWQKAKQYGFTL